MGQPWTRRWRTARGCARCDTACSTPPEHSLAPARQISRVEEVEAVWTGNQPPNILISPSEAIDIWAVPREIGALGMRLMEAARLDVWPPVMQQPDGSWIGRVEQALFAHKRARQTDPRSSPAGFVEFTSISGKPS